MNRLAILPALLVMSPLVMSPMVAWAQAEPPALSGHDHSQIQAQPAEHMRIVCQRMIDEEMKATSRALTSNLAQMKATLPLITDINERSRWQSNIAMWQAVADHFNRLAEHAAQMEKMGMGCGMMMDRGTGHEHTAPATPAKPQ